MGVEQACDWTRPASPSLRRAGDGVSRKRTASVAIESSVSFLGNRLFGFCRSQPFSVPKDGSSKPVRSCNPRLGRFDSCAAPFAGSRGTVQRLALRWPGVVPVCAAKMRTRVDPAPASGDKHAGPLGISG